MIRKDFEEFLGKKIAIRIKNGYRFSGELLELNDFSLVIDDREGKIKFNLYDIISVKQMRW